jgi:hypothetical protein
VYYRSGHKRPGRILVGIRIVFIAVDRIFFRFVAHYLTGDAQ